LFAGLCFFLFKYCIVVSRRGPTDNELEEVVEAVKEIKRDMKLKICACLGILREDQDKRLKEVGENRYNHRRVFSIVAMA
jgi:biotin synthase